MSFHWLRRTTSLDYFVFRADKTRVALRTKLPAALKFTWWTPSWSRIFPPHHRSAHFFLWWLLDRIRLFPPRQYAVLVVTTKDGAFVARVCVMPTWRHTPFINPPSIHLSGIETAKPWRRRGIALAAVEICLDRVSASVPDVFYIARVANHSSHALARSAGFRFFALAHKTPDTLFGRFTTGEGSKPWRVLVIQAWGMGDAIMTISLLRLIRSKLTGARITVLVGGSATGDLLLAADLADDVVIVPQRGSTKQRIGTFVTLRSAHYDCAIVATGLHWAYALLARWVAGIPRVIGDRRAPFFSTLTTVVRNAPEAHRFVANGRLLQTIVPDLADPEIFNVDPLLPMPMPSEGASQFLGDIEKTGSEATYAIHLGSGGQNVKRVPLELALSIVDRLSQRAHGAQFLYIEGPDDPPFDSLPTELQQRMARISHWSTDDLRNLLRQCTAVLSGDTGIAHLTAASGGKAVVLAGPTDVQRTRPWGPDHAVVSTRTPPACMPCYHTKMFYACPHNTVCMTSITPEDVASAMAAGKRAPNSRPAAAR